MRNFFILVIIFLVVSFVSGATHVLLLVPEAITTENIQEDIDEMAHGDTLILWLTNEADGASFVNLILSDNKALMAHPESYPIELDREIIPEHPINTITVFGSGHVEGFIVNNTSAVGCGVWGDNILSVKDCHFGVVVQAVGVGDGASKLEVYTSAFEASHLVTDLINVETFIFSDNIVSDRSRMLKLETVEKAFVRGNYFISDSAEVPLWVTDCDSVDVAQNLFVGGPEGMEAMRFTGENTINVRNNTIVGFSSNGVALLSGDDIAGRVYNNIFYNVNCGVAAFPGEFTPEFFGFNHFGEIHGDETWSVTYGSGVNVTRGDPMFDSDYGLLPGSPCRNTGSDYSDRGFTGGNPNWWDGDHELNVPEPESTVSVNMLTAGPNPFNSRLSLKFSQGAQEVAIYNVGGRLIEKARVEDTQLIWNAKDEIPSGIYIVRVSFSDEVLTTRVNLVK